MAVARSHDNNGSNHGGSYHHECMPPSPSPSDGAALVGGVVVFRTVGCRIRPLDFNRVNNVVVVGGGGGGLLPPLATNRPYVSPASSPPSRYCPRRRRRPRVVVVASVTCRGEHGRHRHHHRAAAARPMPPMAESATSYPPATVARLSNIMTATPRRRPSATMP